MKEIFIWLGLIILFIALCVGAFKLERWINWKLDYGSRVDIQVEYLHKSIDSVKTDYNSLNRRYWDLRADLHNLLWKDVVLDSVHVGAHDTTWYLADSIKVIFY